MKLKKMIFIFLCIWFVASLYLVVPFFWLKYFRFEVSENYSRWTSKHTPPTYIFCGDSHTAGLLNVGYRLGGIRSYFSSRNFGVSGTYTDQILASAHTALDAHPKYLHINFGTNNALHYSENYVDSILLGNLFNKAKEIHCTVIITLTFYNKNSDANRIIEVENEKLQRICKIYNIVCIDLNTIIAPNKVLLDKYTEDNIHLNDLGQKEWVTLIKKVLNPS